MRIRNIFLMAVMLFVPCMSLAQAAAAIDTTANQSWTIFWRQFSEAVRKKDRASLKRMMPNDFSDGGGGLTAGEWLEFIDKNEPNGSWRDFQRSISRGTFIHRKWSRKGILTRVTKDNAYYFEFRKDHRWYFAGVVGD